MNVPEFVKLARKVLNEDAGSEGMVYKVHASTGLRAIENETFKIDEVANENGVTTGKVTFAYPHDYGFALNTIKENLEGINIVGLTLIY